MIKAIIGIIAVLLTFIGYIPYIKDIIAGKTKPHIYSWFLWGFVTAIVFALQFSDNAGIGSFVTLAAALMCFVVIFLSKKFKVTSEITSSDKFFIFLAFITLLIWIVTKQALLSAILATIIDVLAFAPTIRKSWKNPYSETLSFYFLNTFRFGLAVFALSNYSLITAVYPVSWMVINGLFGVMLVVRRKNQASR